jgi:hypothetical protein
MAFKLTYIDGQESDYDDDTNWAIEDGGVLKLGRGDGNWSVLVSPGHWATIELGKAGDKKKDDEAAKNKKDDKDDDGDDDDS